MVFSTETITSIADGISSLRGWLNLARVESSNVYYAHYVVEWPAVSCHSGPKAEVTSIMSLCRLTLLTSFGSGVNK